jgi:hypothetical protein
MSGFLYALVDLRVREPRVSLAELQARLPLKFADAKALGCPTNFDGAEWYALLVDGEPDRPFRVCVEEAAEQLEEHRDAIAWLGERADEVFLNVGIFYSTAIGTAVLPVGVSAALAKLGLEARLEIFACDDFDEE